MREKGPLHLNSQHTMINSGDRRLKIRKVTKMTVQKSRINFHSFSSLDPIHAIHGL